MRIYKADTTAFKHRRPPGWQPVYNERVRVRRPVRPRYRHAAPRCRVVTAIVRCVADDLVYVVEPARAEAYAVLFDDVRPLPLAVQPKELRAEVAESRGEPVP